MAAVLACGEGSALSHDTAGAHWGIRPVTSEIHVSRPHDCKRPGIVAHRRPLFQARSWKGIPVTTIVQTLIDIAPGITRDELEQAINEADKRKLTSPPKLRKALESAPRQPGVGVLKEALDARTFTLTDSQLERLLRPIAKRAGLTRPLTQEWVNGFKVDFYWPELGLVVETDGLSYHRTAAQQTKDLIRDQAHIAAGMTPLRFSRAQVRFEPEHVEATLRKTAARLRKEKGPGEPGPLPSPPSAGR